ncbi:hypothetical protein ASPZODRAFT_18088 [Penicilliopsis zonata CBS 506.65]|uniref:Diphthamide biosynthesis protein 4 n=1 Tax=Penicilliopsis zonata CBS 506.65 TaxID=1073090 RepID=A0A1L9SBN6_9EURO|nr:hypothetical protein ASPZODRAFT_18088 [Penicilliopsis zonata CBS 506.65]OJJ44507.1 hypothetical protein ASPZODRAFT_18088 [Penicilliopsis zonata CBS 506.65]
MTRTDPAHDYYQILNLPFPETSAESFSNQQIKLAYHRALLRHHPDKAGAGETDLKATPSASASASTAANPVSITYTIDQITAAYKTLSSPSLRAEYDRTLRLDRLKSAGREKAADIFHTGLETVDLEDLSCEDGEEDNDDTETCWYRSCRCGDERGFLVRESDLEREAEHGEIVIGCRGCSLWMKILFAVEDG